MKYFNLSDALAYHDRTKHRPTRYAASLGYMDWATQPDPFRHYEDTQLKPLPKSQLSVPYHLLFEPQALPSAPLCRESVGHLLRYSLGLAAWKSHGSSRWALRCNASSGNLQPTECYLIAPPLEGISDQTSLSHYASKVHALEMLSTYDTSLWNTLPDESIIIVLSSLLWREAWKYGERSWRYCQLDAGHAAQAIRVSAATLGWNCTQLSIDTAEISHQLGFDDASRFIPLEEESIDMVLLISSSSQKTTEFSLPLPSSPPLNPANRISPSHHDWPILRVIDEATQGIYPSKTTPFHRSVPPPSLGSSEVILQRRSAQAMNASSISEEQFRQILNSSLDVEGSEDVHFAIFVNRVDGIESGLYFYLRKQDELPFLQKSLNPAFEWLNKNEGLYLLRRGDLSSTAKALSCNQDIARDGAFSFGMLCRFSSTLEEYGAIGYKNLYHQCGSIGQMMYLEATSLGLSATGIGCFLDDEFHHILGIKDETYQSLYHFTIGRAIVDPRLTTEPPY